MEHVDGSCQVYESDEIKRGDSDIAGRNPPATKGLPLLAHAPVLFEFTIGQYGDYHVHAGLNFFRSILITIRSNLVRHYVLHTHAYPGGRLTGAQHRCVGEKAIETVR